MIICLLPFPLSYVTDIYQILFKSILPDSFVVPNYLHLKSLKATLCRGAEARRVSQVISVAGNASANAM